MENPVNRASADMTLSERSHGRYSGAIYVPDSGFIWSRARPSGIDSGIGPWLVPVGPDGPITAYPPMRRPGIVGDLDTLAAGRRELGSLIQFANRYGPLTEAGEDLRRWSDELSEWQRLRKLWKAARAGWRGQLMSRVRWQPLDSEPSSIPSPGAITVDGKITAWADDSRGVAPYLGRDPVRVAYYHVVHEINRKLLTLGSKGHGTELQLIAFATEPPRWHPGMSGLGSSELKIQIRSALAAVYVHFALEIVGKPGVDRDCRACGTPIIGARRNQVYCSTQCQQRAAYRRRRDGGRR